MYTMQHHITRYFLKVTGICVALLAAGFLFAQFMDARTETNKRNALIKDAQQLALSVESSDIATLKADQSDIQNPRYAHLKDVFTVFRSTDSNVRFAYLLGFKESIGKQFFYVDSEDPSSKDYSPPGQIYDDTKIKDIAGYLSGVAYAEDAYRDAWGEWISAYAPIRDANGQIIAQVGIDVSTSRWHRQTLINNVFIGIIILLLCVITLLVASVFYKKQQKFSELQGEKEALLKDISALKSVQILASVGRITVHFPSKRISLDEQFAPIFKGQNLAAIDFNDFRARVHPDDIVYCEKFLTEIGESSVTYTWCDMRFGDRDSGFRQYHIYGNVKKEDDATVFSGIMQDITDIKS